MGSCRDHDRGGILGALSLPRPENVARVGEGVVHWPTLFSVGLFPVIVLAYGLLARSEEKRVVEQFGEEYRDYQRRVPMFFPRLGQWRQLVERSSVEDVKDDQQHL